jgi:hypothetical protein
MPSLQSINVDENNLNYCSVDGVLFTKDMQTIIEYPEGKEMSEYRIPDGIINIGKQAFTYCDNLKNVIVPNSVTNINETAFLHCDNLSGIVFESSESWKVVERDGDIYTNISVTDANEAARLLVYTYNDATWTRSDV